MHFDSDSAVTGAVPTVPSYKIVVPAEATRDVLSGRVPYLLVEDEGVTVFRPVHMFAALKLKKETMTHLEDYSCLGAHERFLEKRPKKRVGLGYRRKYISPELIGRGIFVVIVGNGGVGKSSMIQRYCKGTFTKDYKKTIGVDFLERQIEVDGEDVRLMLWDTAGQEEFDAITKAYYRGAQACVLAFSTVDRDSFEAAHSWKLKILQEAPEKEEQNVGPQEDEDDDNTRHAAIENPVLGIPISEKPLNYYNQQIIFKTVNYEARPPAISQFFPNKLRVHVQLGKNDLQADIVKFFKEFLQPERIYTCLFETMNYTSI
ncbi:unnamed protein product [Psylliodes chrysocephalus]|uniref:Uncharacterized protein n=1 Tax=Psylliodes chrysocephalus TaxID=3402493 RepID=A0A9P0CZH4_9CUCU|nr:unnamed protein product [Psylliodes chrysocephala]